MRKLALLLVLDACAQPRAATPREPEAVTRGATVPRDPVCAALLPRVAGAWDSRAERAAVIAPLVAGAWVDACNHEQSPPAVPPGGSDEGVYCRAAIEYELCDRGDLVLRVSEGRTAAFPSSADAWLALATLKFRWLTPNEENPGIPYNEMIPPQERLRIADEVLAALGRAAALRPDDARVFAMIAAVHTQRMMARIVVERPTTPAEQQAIVDARNDAELAWQAHRKVCALERRPSCSRADATRVRASFMEGPPAPEHEEVIEEEEVPLEVPVVDEP